MRIEISSDQTESDIVLKIEMLSGQNMHSCYQCGKCSSGCPGTPEMDILPNEVIRLIQMGRVDEVLSSDTIWFCASCMTCLIRCPKGVDLAKIMEALRVTVLRSRESRDHTTVSEIPESRLNELPQVAIVSNLRKMT